MTLEQVASQCKMHYTQVSKIERGKFRFANSNVQNMCNLVGVDPEASDGSSPEELHACLDRLLREKPGAAVALRAVFEAFDQMSN